MADHSESMSIGLAFSSMRWNEKAAFCAMLPVLVLCKLLSTVFELLCGKEWLAGTPWLEKVSDKIWVANGWMTWLPTFPLTMTIVKLTPSDGSPCEDLLLYSALYFNEDLARQIEALGNVRYIAVPSIFHDSFSNMWKQRFPEARLICAADARHEIEKAYPIDSTFEEELPPFDMVLHNPTLFLYPNFALGERVFEVPSGMKGECGEESRALLFSDLVQNNPPNTVLTASPMGWAGLRVARFFKLVGVRDRNGLRMFVTDLCRNVRNFEIAVFSHGHAPLVGIKTPQTIASAVSKHLSDELCY